MQVRLINSTEDRGLVPGAQKRGLSGPSEFNKCSVARYLCVMCAWFNLFALPSWGTRVANVQRPPNTRLNELFGTFLQKIPTDPRQRVYPSFTWKCGCIRIVAFRDRGRDFIIGHQVSDSSSTMCTAEGSHAPVSL